MPASLVAVLLASSDPRRGPRGTLGRPAYAALIDLTACRTLRSVPLAPRNGPLSQLPTPADVIRNSPPLRVTGTVTWRNRVRPPALPAGRLRAVESARTGCVSRRPTAGLRQRCRTRSCGHRYDGHFVPA